MTLQVSHQATVEVDRAVFPPGISTVLSEDGTGANAGVPHCWMWVDNETDDDETDDKKLSLSQGTLILARLCMLFTSSMWVLEWWRSYFSGTCAFSLAPKMNTVGSLLVNLCTHESGDIWIVTYTTCHMSLLVLSCLLYRSVSLTGNWLAKLLNLQ